MSFAFGRGRGSIIVALAALLTVSFTTASPAGEKTSEVTKDPSDVVSAKAEIIRKALLARSRSLESVLLFCGDGGPDPGETCDDGNTAPGDGCSTTCQIEPGWECTLPVDTINTGAVADGSMELGSPNPNWAETGTVFNPICSTVTCGGLPDDGSFFAWFGGVSTPNDQTLTQMLTIPASATTLEFQLLVGICDSLADVLEVEIDGNVVYSTFPCAVNGSYTTQVIDLATAPLGPYNDGAVHTLVFHGSTIAANLGNTNYFVDSIEILEPLIPPILSACVLADTCFLEEFENGLGGWTTFEVGADLPWGTTDDGFCGSVNWPVGNYTDGPGEAACIDSDAAGLGFGVVDSYLCSPPVDLSSASGAALDFVYNYQMFGGPLADDFFEVLVGVLPPAPANLPSYTLLLSRSTPAGALVGSGASESLSLQAFEGSTVYICLRYGADFDWYAQVDSFHVNASTCDGSPPLETSPPGTVEPFMVGRSSTEANQLDLSWEFTPGAASYRIIAGDLDSLQGAGGVTVGNAAPIACGIVGLSASLPEPAGSKFLLVAAEGPGGVGPLGSGLPATPRTASLSCP